MLVLLFILISRLSYRSGLRISHSKVFSSVPLEIQPWHGTLFHPWSSSSRTGSLDSGYLSFLESSYLCFSFGAMETPQHGNGPIRKRAKKWLLVRFLLCSRNIGNPSKTEKCWGISEYFWPISAIFNFFRTSLVRFRFSESCKFLVFGSV